MTTVIPVSLHICRLIRAPVPSIVVAHGASSHPPFERNTEYDDYRREKTGLEERLAGLVIPGVDAAKEAGRLLESLPAFWAAATLAERRKLLLAMLDTVYVDTVEEKAIVAIRPKPAFGSLFEIATTRTDNGVVLINETPQVVDEPGAADSCFWWRLGWSNYT